MKLPPIVPQLWRACLLLFSALVTVTRSLAQSDLGVPSPAAEYLMSHWTSDDGLPQNSVISMAQTADGYIWVSTFGGIARFDGLHFEVFDGDIVPALAGVYFTTLRADKLGNLWLHSEQKRLVVGRNGSFRTVDDAGNSLDAPIYAIEVGADGMMWAGDQKGRLLRFDGERFQVICATPPAPDWGALGRMTASADGSIWSQAPKKLAQFKDGKWTITYRSENDCPVLPMRNGSVLIVDGSSYDRIYRMKDGHVSEYTRIPGGFTGYFIREDAQGNVWTTAARGILRLDPAGRWTHLTPADGLMVDTVRSELADREGNFWLGTDGGGLVRLKRRAIHGVGEAEGMTKRIALSASGDGQGGIWAAALGGGLNHFDGERFTALPDNLSKAYPLVWCVHPARDGGAWLGTYGMGLLHLDATRQRVDAFSETYPGMMRSPIFSVLEDRSGQVWFGGEHGGLGRLSSGTIRTWTTTNGLADNRVDAIAEDRAGAIWIGTRKGINRLTHEELVTFTTADGLAHNVVRALFCDVDGTLWIGGRGVTRFRAGKFSPIHAADGLPVEVIKGIVEDDLGHLWFSTPHGLLRGDKQMLNDFCDGRRAAVAFHIFDKTDGLPSNECSGYQPAAWKNPDGRLYFPTLNGIAIVNPGDLPKNELAPSVVIESVMADEQRQFVGTNAVQIASGTGRVAVRYTALSFTAPERNRFRYRLANLDPFWREAGTEREAIYTRLPPGNYRFEVTGSNNDGVWNGNATSLALIVLPEWWQTWIFRVAVALALFTAGWAAYRARIRALTHARVLQEEFSRRLIASQEAERQRIARELHDSLGQNLLVIKSRVDMAQQQAGQPEKLSEQLAEAAAMTSGAIREVREISQNLRPFQLDELGLTKALGAMVRKLAAASPLHFATDVAELRGALSSEGEINLYRIIQECLNNVVKHSEATECRLTVQRDSRVVQVSIADNGRGMGEAGRAAVSNGDSFGLTSIRERVRTLGGTVEFISRPGEGTWVIVIVPLPGRA